MCYGITVLDRDGDRLFFLEGDDGGDWVEDLSLASFYKYKSDALDALFRSAILPGTVENIGILIPVDEYNNIDIKTLQLTVVDVISTEDLFDEDTSNLLEKIANSDTIADTAKFSAFMETKMQETVKDENDEEDEEENETDNEEESVDEVDGLTENIDSTEDGGLTDNDYNKAAMQM